MKKFFVTMALALPLLLAGCVTKSELDSKLSELEQRLAKLEEQVSQLNSQVSVIKTLLTGKYFVQSVSDLPDGTGYSLILVSSEGSTVEKIVHNGTNGDTPQVSVKMDTDGNYYWTVNGEWMLVDGKKVKASGNDGLTPEFKVEGGKWYVRLGGGSWTYAGEAVTEAETPITDVDTSRPDTVVFTLADGTTIEVPRASAAKLQLIVSDSAFLNMAGGDSRTVNYEVKAPAGITYSLSSYEPQGWKVVFSQPVNHKGTVTLTLPADSADGKVLLIVTGSDGSCFLKVLPVGVEGSAGHAIQTAYTVDSSAGSLDLPAGAQEIKNLSGASWISIKGTQLLMSENTDYDPRSALISYVVDGLTYEATIIQAQRDAIVLDASGTTVSALPGDGIFIVNANVDVEASTNADWVTIDPPTKGLEAQCFIYHTQFNGGAERSAEINFTYGELSQKLTLTQASVEKEAVVAKAEPGCYLGGTMDRSYQAGKDQYCRSYEGEELSFVLMEPAGLEQVAMSGLSTSMKPGDPVSVSVKWVKGEEEKPTLIYDMYVLKEQDETVWLGDSMGRGFVVKK